MIGIFHLHTGKQFVDPYSRYYNLLRHSTLGRTWVSTKSALGGVPCLKVISHTAKIVLNLIKKRIAPSSNNSWVTASTELEQGEEPEKAICQLRIIVERCLEMQITLCILFHWLHQCTWQNSAWHVFWNPIESRSTRQRNKHNQVFTSSRRPQCAMKTKFQ